LTFNQVEASPSRPTSSPARPFSQTVEVKGPLGPILGGMLGPQVSKEFGTLLANLAKKAEAAA
jgi:hypothetical protein